MAVEIVYAHHADTDRWFYDKIPGGHDGWDTGREWFGVHDDNIDGTVAIYRHGVLNPAPGDDRYFYDRIANPHDGWLAGQVAFYAFTDEAPGTVGVYQHRILPKMNLSDRYMWDLQPLPAGNFDGGTNNEPVWYAYPPEDTTLLSAIAGTLYGIDPAYAGLTYSASDNNAVALHDTPHLWGDGPSVPPARGKITAVNDLCGAIQETICAAHHLLDFALLWNSDPICLRPGRTALPEGAFRDAIGKGLAALATSGTPPTLVRIVIGVPVYQLNPNPDGFAASTKKWLHDTLAARNVDLGHLPFSVMIGFCNVSLTSFNHSKIVAADRVQAVVGGHNMWPDSYDCATPVHDVSCVVFGAAAGDAHSFCDRLWLAAENRWMLSSGTWSFVRTPAAAPTCPPADKAGTASMLALGRLGAATPMRAGAVASVGARLMAICRATTTIRISQQSLDVNLLGSGGFDFYTMWALLQAIGEGVAVQVVVSNDDTLSGYGGRAQEVADAFLTLAVLDNIHDLGFVLPLNPPRSDLAGWAAAAQQQMQYTLPIGNLSRVPAAAEWQPIADKLNQFLTVAPLYFAENRNSWPDGKPNHAQAANHAKVWVIDDDHFYVGSDNMYTTGHAAGLAEFGYLISGVVETGTLLEQYWAPLWRYSSTHPVRPSVPQLQKWHG
jgi:phosphatidylserine/phosphatidylglycerophosphate/cardiolipin synthase-like enzyme